MDVFYYRGMIPFRYVKDVSPIFQLKSIDNVGDTIYILTTETGQPENWKIKRLVEDGSVTTVFLAERIMNQSITDNGQIITVTSTEMAWAYREHLNYE